MKIAVQTSDKINVDENFGRAGYYAIYETDKEEIAFLSNENAEAAHGVGIQSAALLSRNGIDWVVTYRVGPKAKDTLEQTGIKVFLLPEDIFPLRIEEAIEKFLEKYLI